MEMRELLLEVVLGVRPESQFWGRRICLSGPRLELGSGGAVDTSARWVPTMPSTQLPTSNFATYVFQYNTPLSTQLSPLFLPRSFAMPLLDWRTASPNPFAEPQI